MAGSAAAALRGPVRGPHPGGPELPWRPGSSRRRLGAGGRRVSEALVADRVVVGPARWTRGRQDAGFRRRQRRGGAAASALACFRGLDDAASLSLLPTKQRTQPAEKDAARAPSPRKRPFPRRRRAAAVPSFRRSLHRTCLRLPTQKRRGPSPRRFRGRRVTSRHRGITRARRPSGCRTEQKPHKSPRAVAPRQISMGRRATPHRNL